MNTPDYALKVIKTLKKAGHKAFLVGGCVRDHLRGVHPKDYDVATSAHPEQVMTLFPRVIPTGIKHGTVTIPDMASTFSHPAFVVEVTTFRGDGAYADGRRPESVVFLDSIEADLARRDFTMNAIAYDPTEDVYVDPFGGKEAIAEKIVRCVGSPMDRFTEDGLRPLRALRFASTFQYRIDATTYKAISATKSIYEKVAVERVMEELRKILVNSPVPSRGLYDLLHTGLMERIIPGLRNDTVYSVSLRMGRVDKARPDFATRLAALLYGHTAALETLKLPTEIVNRVRRMEKFGCTPLQNTMTDAELRRFASKVGPDSVADVTWFMAAVAECDTPEVFSSFKAATERLNNQMDNDVPLVVGDLAINGEDVEDIVGKGRAVGMALKKLLDAVIEDPSRNTKEGLLQLLG